MIFRTDFLFFYNALYSNNVFSWEQILILILTDDSSMLGLESSAFGMHALRRS